MTEYYPLLKLIEQRVPMYTGQWSLYSIHTYLSGYSHALRDNKIEQKSPPSISFFDWVAKKLGYYESTAGWANMTLAYSLGLDSSEIEWEPFFQRQVQITEQQHINSVKLFYKLLEEFKLEVEEV